MIRTIAADLGLTGRCALLSSVAAALFIVACVWKVDALHGAVMVLAFAAGTLWNREIRCDGCGTSLESEDAEYFAHDAADADAFTRLVSERDPAVRADLLETLAMVDAHKAGLHTELYGVDPNEDEGGRDLAESLASSAMLLRALAATERALVTDQPRKRATDERVEEAGSHLLDDLAITSDRAKRAWLCKALRDAVEPIVGGQAVEGLACVARCYADPAS